MSSAFGKYFKLKLNLQILVGIVLVAVSIVGVVLIVFANTKTISVYTATKTISVGQVVDPMLLKEVEIPEGAFSKLYFSAHNFLAGIETKEYIARYPIFEGEPILLSALASADASKTSVVIPIKSKLSDSLGPGSRVAIWVSKNDVHSSLDQEEEEGRHIKKIISEAEIVRIAKDEVLGSVSANSVEVRVSIADVAVLLDAIAHDDFVSVVPQINTSISSSSIGESQAHTSRSN